MQLLAVVHAHEKSAVIAADWLPIKSAIAVENCSSRSQSSHTGCLNVKHTPHERHTQTKTGKPGVGKTLTE